LLWFVVRRLGAAIATLVVVSALVFSGTEVLPGDAAGAVLGRAA
jgi:peptide/nickel transport system permease protein